ncbi:hypothetical protein A8144_12205 [Mycobacterium leprae 3125609]|nr:hypothetical protein A8144_12205 [Mycobacterium leprae 3125609]OAX70478.1 hypothetical protein A3216_11720 [Mycobacterium leprae 7935681]
MFLFAQAFWRRHHFNWFADVRVTIHKRQLRLDRFTITGDDMSVAVAGDGLHHSVTRCVRSMLIPSPNLLLLFESQLAAYSHRRAAVGVTLAASSGVLGICNSGNDN